LFKQPIYFDFVYSPSAQTDYLSQHRSYILSISDQTLLTNVFGTYERIYPGANSCQYSLFPAIEHTVIHTFYNEYEERYKRLVEYFNFIPEFIRLSINDKVQLLQNHVGMTSSINERIIARSLTHNLSASAKNIFGIKLGNALLYATERVVTYTSDSVLLKLILIIQNLSCGINKYNDDVGLGLTYDDTLLIFASQNIYVEVLWRYLLSRLSSEKEVVKFFNKLILDLLFLQRVCNAVERFVFSLENEIDKLEPLMQSLWSKDEKVVDMDYDNTNMESYS
jgi:hypothetical protein